MQHGVVFNWRILGTKQMDSSLLQQTLTCLERHNWADSMKVFCTSPSAESSDLFTRVKQNIVSSTFPCQVSSLQWTMRVWSTNSSRTWATVTMTEVCLHPLFLLDTFHTKVGRLVMMMSPYHSHSAASKQTLQMIMFTITNEHSVCILQVFIVEKNRLLVGHQR